MKRAPVKSSNLKSVGYDNATYKLEIEFDNGSIYVYERVPHHIYLALMQADSKGGFFARRIRDDYTHTKIKAAAT